VVSYKWDKQGSFNILVRAQDEYGVWSNWSDHLVVNMPKNKSYINTPLLNFLEQHPHQFQILRQLLKLY